MQARLAFLSAQTGEFIACPDAKEGWHQPHCGSYECSSQSQVRDVVDVSFAFNGGDLRCVVTSQDGTIRAQFKLCLQDAQALARALPAVLPPPPVGVTGGIATVAA